jgi:hypothetical protein
MRVWPAGVFQAAMGDGFLWQWSGSFASLREQHLEPLERRGHIGIELDADGGQMPPEEFLVCGEPPFACAVALAFVPRE